MTDEFNPERARDETIVAIDRVATTLLANREQLANDMVRMYPEASAPKFGDAAVNMALNILAVLRGRVSTDPDLRNAADILPPGDKPH
jgi:hypothetical protein